MDYIHKNLPIGFDKTVLLTLDSLKSEGFEILMEVDMQEKLKEKLGVQSRKYKIMQVCNYSFVNLGMQETNKSGTILIYTVIIKELGNSQTSVEAIDPNLPIITKEPELTNIAAEIRKTLTRIIYLLNDKNHFNFYY